MFVTKLLKLYPNGILSKKQATTTTYLSLPIDDGYFIIEKAQLTTEEQKLLETFFRKILLIYNYVITGIIIYFVIFHFQKMKAYSEYCNFI